MREETQKLFQFIENSPCAYLAICNVKKELDRSGYRELLEQDIREGNLYVLSDKGQIHGVFAFFLGEDPTYRVIQGKGWRSTAPYGTIHRIAGDGSGGILHACVGYCRKRIGYLRIDTHEDNRVMQGAVKKEGFVPCGIIHIADGSPRIAYDLM